MAQTSAMTIAVNIFTSPREAFAAIREKTQLWLPLILIMLGTGLTAFVYMNGVDIEWFYEQQIRLSNPDVTDAQVEQTVNAVSNIPQTVLAAIGGLTSMLAIAIILLLYAAYLRIITAVLKDGMTYRQWFGLACWCSLPALLSSIATLVNLLTSDISLMPQTDVNPLSWVNLFGLDSAGSGTIDRIVMNMDVTSVWGIVLLAIGYNAWTKKGIPLSAFIVIAPYLLLVGVALAA